MPASPHPQVTLAIPGRNCAATIDACLAALAPMLDDPVSRLAEIIFVDDGSTDDTPQRVVKYPVRLVPGTGTGPAAARNLGFRAANTELVWFVDSDCVAEPDALRQLLPHMDDPKVGGVSGSYGNMRPESLLACLMHEEIIERHRRMPREVDFLATFNVLYRKAALEKVGGFDERYKKAQDAELSFRVQQAGYELRFELESRVKHFHENRWLNYLRTQRLQGFYRLWLHLAHPGHNLGDSYSNFIDHIQPPLAMLSLAGLPLVWLPWGWLVSVGAVALLGLAQLPMTIRLVARTGQAKYLLFAWMSFVRSYWRGVGLTQGVLAYVLKQDPNPEIKRRAAAEAERSNSSTR